MLSDTVEELRSLAAEAEDASGYFPAMYSCVTAAVERRCRERGFRDPDRMVRFAKSFADYYLRAQSEPGRAPRCWRAARAVATDPDLVITQHLLLGINAHINHDLPQVVADLAAAGSDTASLREDFDAINDLLAAVYGDVTRSLHRVAWWTAPVAALGGARLFDFSLRVARRQAWATAQRLSSLPPRERAADVAELDELVSVLAYLVTQPRFPMSLLLPLLRRLEQRDPRQVVDALLQARAPHR